MDAGGPSGGRRARDPGGSARPRTPRREAPSSPTPLLILRRGRVRPHEDLRDGRRRVADDRVRVPVVRRAGPAARVHQRKQLVVVVVIVILALVIVLVVIVAVQDVLSLHRLGLGRLRGRPPRPRLVAPAAVPLGLEETQQRTLSPAARPLISRGPRREGLVVGTLVIILPRIVVNMIIILVVVVASRPRVVRGDGGVPRAGEHAGPDARLG
mmetsp:Transcript_7871/g.31167  ORF Transcript_7871/g.31167 Transcript_7871/m.31167 type:complete len:212 (+) Transcript_7871:81-716(+)